MTARVLQACAMVASPWDVGVQLYSWIQMTSCIPNRMTTRPEITYTFSKMCKFMKKVTSAASTSCTEASPLPEEHNRSWHLLCMSGMNNMSLHITDGITVRQNPELTRFEDVQQERIVELLGLFLPAHLRVGCLLLLGEPLLFNLS